ncbi:hypothetical protein HPB51_009909 [Rhipicephalus microplus]|uniref:Uncharacterized protein n=1 Tax=Rhipicephalus microplus TaxID=6941 RepID=A0A9J6ESU7_RHIMP|nr:hypothetical protein HPB51_009909 [Rhipicephalus microplus]
MTVRLGILSDSGTDTVTKSDDVFNVYQYRGRHPGGLATLGWGWDLNGMSNAEDSSLQPADRLIAQQLDTFQRAAKLCNTVMEQLSSLVLETQPATIDGLQLPPLPGCREHVPNEDTAVKRHLGEGSGSGEDRYHKEFVRDMDSGERTGRIQLCFFTSRKARPPLTAWPSGTWQFCRILTTLWTKPLVLPLSGLCRLLDSVPTGCALAISDVSVALTYWTCPTPPPDADKSSRKRCPVLGLL